MAITITISDGTNTVTLSGTDAYCETYQPVTPEAGAESVVETLEVEFFGNLATIDANLQKLERLFGQARERQNGASGVTKVYLTVTLDSDAWQSELYDGKTVSTPAFIKVERVTGVRKESVIVERAPWWDAVTSAQISLTNGNGTDNTAGLEVYNCNDGSGSSPNKLNNYIEITAAKVLGDLPAPAYIRLESQGATTIGDLMISQNVFSDPANLTTLYEGETGSGDATDAAYSGGKYHAFSGTDIVIPKLLTTMVAKLQGGYYRVLGRLNDAGGNAWKIKPFAYDGITYFYGPNAMVTISAASRWYDFGIINLPPVYVPGKSYAYLAFGIEAIKGTSGTLNLDCLHLAPLDGWKRVKMNWDSSTKFVIDEYAEMAYGLDLTNKVDGYASASGGRLMVWPNRLQRFSFVWNKLSSAAASPITDNALAYLFYQPRRRTI